jgi:hypothetical protein
MGKFMVRSHIIQTRIGGIHMKLVARVILGGAISLGAVIFFPAANKAQEHHPAYLHALADLRAARFHLQHEGGGGTLRQDEKEAIKQIDDAMAEIKNASIDDGKNLGDQPQGDAGLDHKGHLHRAKQLLEKAHSDIEGEEGNHSVQGLRDRSFSHIDKAIHNVDSAIRALEGSS